MTTLATDNIDRLTAEPTPSGWRVRFRSAHAGLCHQLYVNGRLADFTDTPAGRAFDVPAGPEPRELCIAAVEPARRGEDLSGLLPPALREPGWLYTATVVREPGARAGDLLAVRSDRADAPLRVRESAPDWLPRWGFGESAFGLGAAGYGGIGAPGLGRGGFGAGPFGFGAEVLELRVPLAADGTHAITLCTRSADGQTTDTPGGEVVAHPPPAPPAALHATAYDPQTHALTLTLEDPTP